jgi:hypothetical protein
MQILFTNRTYFSHIIVNKSMYKKIKKKYKDEKMGLILLNIQCTKL